MDGKKLDILLKTIELLRTELDEIAGDVEKLTNPEVVKKSQELDKLLTEYYLILKQEKDKKK